MERLFHKEIYWENSFENGALKLFEEVDNSDISLHLENEHLKNPDKKHPYDFNGLSNAIEKIKNKKNGYIFEVAENNGCVVKAVCRISYDNNRDISIVVRKRRNGKVFIVTAWVNYKTDKHFTLDKSKYICYDKIVREEN